MKHSALIAILLALGLAGCGKKDATTSPPPASGSGTMAPQVSSTGPTQNQAGAAPTAMASPSQGALKAPLVTVVASSAAPGIATPAQSAPKAPLISVVISASAPGAVASSQSASSPDTSAGGAAAQPPSGDNSGSGATPSQ
jgi:hypothetical protein